MPVNLNLNVDCTDVVKRSALPVVARLQSHTRYQRKRKLIAMAKECSSKLKIADWNVVEWPPEKITVGLVEAIAASKKCSSVLQCRKVAWELSGVDHPLSEVQHYVVKYLNVYDCVFTILGEDELFDTFRKILASLVEGISSRLVCSAIQNSERVEARQGMLFPLWSFVDETRTAFPDWSAEVVAMYQNEWNTALQELHQLNDVADDSWSPEEGFLRYAIDIVDVYATARLGYKYGIDFQIKSRDGYDRLYSERYLPLEIVKTQMFRFVAQQVATLFLSRVLMSEYVKFIHHLLQKRSSVGKRTNFVRLRDNHVFSRRTTDSDRSVFTEFTSSFSRLKIGTELLLDDRNESDDIDCLGMISEVLGGRIEKCSNVQVSLVHQVLGTNVAEKTSLLGKIGRRHVRMLKCGRDHVLVVPYLNMILLKLNDSRWVRDLDVEALQPFVSWFYLNEGAIRRVANILLALENPKEGEPFVNEIAFKLLLTYAEKGELYSMELRKRLLAQVRMKERVGLDALTITAEEVFGEKDEYNVAGLVREMIHDRLLMMRSDNGWEREENEQDAYYDAVYLKRGYSTRNNVEWTQGVPLNGLHFKGLKNYTGMMGEDDLRGCVAFFRGGSKDEKLVFWVLERRRTGDKHRPNVFIGKHSESNLLDMNSCEPTFYKFVRSYVGRYCPSSFEMKRKQE